MRSISTLFISLAFFASAFLMFNGPKKSEPLESTQGERDDPYGAMKFRFNMIAGNKGYIDPQSRLNAIEYTNQKLQYDNKLMKTNGISAWSPLGPGNIGGRIRSIIVRPSNTSNLLVGGVSGGVWKSTDGGASWTPQIDNGAQLAISCMVKDPSNENIIYAGTGEGWGNVDAVYGGGIYKSTDFGDTWTLLSSTIGTNVWNFRNVRSMAFDPSGNLYAVTWAYNYEGGVGNYYSNGGLYKSTDGGISWTAINSTTFVTNYFTGCDVIPFSSSTIIFATEPNGATLGGIYRTTDGGTTWNEITASLPTTNYSRIAFAKDPNNANIAFAQYESQNYGSPDYGLSGIFKTTDAGATWTALTKPGNISSTGDQTISARSFLGLQGWYDNVIAVDPFNSSNIYVGGVDMMKSTNGGTSWFQLTYWDPYYGTPVIHSDHHAITFDPVTANIVYAGDDGGIQKTTNGGTTWSSLNNNLAITQFYGGAVFPTGTTYYGGTQDNGHLKFTSGTNWNEAPTGDGGYAAQDQTNSLVAYEEYVYLQMSKTTDGGTTWNSCTSGLTDVNTGLCLFISPFSMDPQNSSVLIASSDKVWLTSNSASTWTKVSNSLYSGQYATAVTVANAASPFLGFAGTGNGHVFKCTSLVLANGTSNTWTDITPPGNNGAYVRRISIDPANQQNIYVCYSGYNNNGLTPTKHVWFSTNQGTSWTDKSGDLPDVPVHSLLVDNNNSSILYIGTETGVYQSTNGGTNWTAATSGMPAFAPVDELVYQQGSNFIFAFTHGRSAFMTTTPTPVELTDFTGSVAEGKVNLKWNTKTEINTQSFIIEKALVFDKINGSLVFSKLGEVKASGNSNISRNYSFSDYNITSGVYYYRLKILDNNGDFKYSPEIQVTVSSPVSFEVSQNYPNPFNPTSSIKYSIPSDANVSLIVYNIKGEVVKKLVNSFQKAGYYTTTMDGAGLANGIYFYRIDAGKFSQTKKMILLK
jgi:photosystem II stability/assembly factor-like uncharacterized protein